MLGIMTCPNKTALASRSRHTWQRDQAATTGRLAGGLRKPIRPLPTRAQTNRWCLQTRSRRPHTTTRYERDCRENAPTIRVRSEQHRTARTDLLYVFSPVPPDSATRRHWRGIPKSRDRGGSKTVPRRPPGKISINCDVRPRLKAGNPVKLLRLSFVWTELRD
jgi:hypothetical protein